MRAPRLVLLVLAWSLTGLVSCQGDPPDDGIQQPRVDLGPISDWPGRVDAGAVISNPGTDQGAGGQVTNPPAMGSAGGGATVGGTAAGGTAGGATVGGGTAGGGGLTGGAGSFDAGVPTGGLPGGPGGSQDAGASVPVDAGAPADADLDEDAAQDGAADGSTNDAGRDSECVFGWLGRGCRRPAQDP